MSVNIYTSLPLALTANPVSYTHLIDSVAKKANAELEELTGALIGLAKSCGNNPKTENTCLLYTSRCV